MTSHGLCVLRRSGNTQLLYAYSGGYCLLGDHAYEEKTLPTSTEELRGFIVNNGADREVEVTADNWLLVFLYDKNKWYTSSLHQSRVEIKRPRTPSIHNDVDIKDKKHTHKKHKH